MLFFRRWSKSSLERRPRSATVISFFNYDLEIDPLWSGLPMLEKAVSETNYSIYHSR